MISSKLFFDAKQGKEVNLLVTGHVNGVSLFGAKR
jgi:hypothetical protein